ncbi:MAG TPA: VOC family protein [Steroidobacter sp.]|nr:VOC family protein [Steroidobacteraceae bacterium]HLS81064.1 VOC family protein [Steroidobacter sp.]
MSTRSEATSSDARPAVLGGVIPYLQIDGASAAAEFYVRAFGAVEVFRHPVDEQGRTMHIHLYINNGSLMLCDSYPEHGQPAEKPQGYTLTLPVDDADQWFERAVAAGAEVLTPVQDMFWGDRYGEVRDRFGVRWAVNGPAK